MANLNEAIPQEPSHYPEGSADHSTPPGDGTISDDAERLAQARMQHALEVAPRAEGVAGDDAESVEQQRKALQRMAEADESGKES